MGVLLSHVSVLLSPSQAEFTKRPCPVFLYFESPYCCQYGSFCSVKFSKCPCLPVRLKGPGPCPRLVIVVALEMVIPMA